MNVGGDSRGETGSNLHFLDSDMRFGRWGKKFTEWFSSLFEGGPGTATAERVTSRELMPVMGPETSVTL
jgi:hypothetical protein